MRPVIDGHNDVLSHLQEQDAPDDALLDDDAATVTVPRAREGGFAAGMFAVLPPPPHFDEMTRTAGGYDIPYSPQVPWEESARTVGTLAARLFRLLDACDGAVRLIKNVDDLDACLAGEALGVVLHFEGAEPIDEDLDALEVWYAAGLRSLGPVWSRQNAFAHGVPFRYPSSPDTGPGLTDAGRALVRACNELKIVIDLSHLNEQGFWEVAKRSTAPLVASHSNAHALCPCSRNLTDRQLDAIRESGGLVGLNFAVGFLRADGRDDADTPLDAAAEHLDHLVARLGIDGVGIGSDFDGCTVPAPIRDAAGLPRLFELLRARGWDEPSLKKLAHENWLRVLERTWGG
jgi:membrane dipeptidase